MWRLSLCFALGCLGAFGSRAEDKADTPATPPAASTPRTEYTLTELSARFSKAVFKIEIVDKSGATAGSGTAFAVSADGLLITNYHVASAGDRMFAVDSEKKRHPVTQTLATHQADDLALLRISAKTPVFVELAEESEAPVGGRIAVIGGPLGLEGTLSEGIIAAYRSLPEAGLDGRFMQITAPISPGSSGSPVFLMNGKLSGVATANLAGGQQLNFAVPVVRVRELIKNRVSAFISPTQAGKSEEPLEGDEPIYKDADFRRARLILVRGGAAGARPKFEALLPKYPQSAALLAHIGECLTQENRLPEALDYFKHAGKLAPSVPYVWEMYGRALEKGGHTPQAIQAYAHAVKLDQSLHGTSADLARLYAKQGDNLSATRMYKAALKSSTARPEWSVELARLQMDQKDWAGGYEVLAPLVEKASLESSGTNMQVLQLARRCLLEDGRSTKDLDEKIRALAAKPAEKPTGRAGGRPVIAGKTSSLLGSWRSSAATITLEEDGTFQLSVSNSSLTGYWVEAQAFQGYLYFKGRRSYGLFSFQNKNTLIISVPNTRGELESYTITR